MKNKRRKSCKNTTSYKELGIRASFNFMKRLKQKNI